MAYLRLQPERYPALTSTRTLFTVHNVGYRGLFDASVFARLQVDSAHYWPNFEFYGNISYLKAGLSLADRLTTVSPSYAEEVRTPEQGCGLDGVFRERAGDLTGIMNGADYGVWDPAVDAFIVRRYSAAAPDGKHDCKRDLQQRLDLPPSDAPLAGMVARLADQKGLDVLAGALDALLSRDLQIAVLGTGDPHHEQMLSGFARRHPDRMAVRIGFDEELAHVIEAGSDLFLMPSRYEPSGLNQLYSLRYGTIPVVRATGGLKRLGRRPSTRNDGRRHRLPVRGLLAGGARRRPSTGRWTATARPDAWRRLDGERHGAGLLHGPYRRGVCEALYASLLAARLSARHRPGQASGPGRM